MDKPETYYTDLIIRYLAKETSDAEILELKKWLNTDAAHREEFTEIRSTWILAETARLSSDAIVEEEWANLRSRIRPEEKIHASSHTEEAPVAQPVKRMMLPLVVSRVLRIAAIFLLLAVPSFFLYRYLSEPGFIEMTADSGMIDIVLPDGTSVSLNQGSSLIYPEEFKGRLRSVALRGEAFFNVKHLSDKRFVIHAGNVQIEDIGTAFYVNTEKSAHEMEVVLTEGKAAVSFKEKPGSAVEIVPGEKAEVNILENRIETTVNDDVNFLAWKTRKLVFSGNTLEEVVYLLNRVYTSDIRIKGENIKNCRLTVIFDNQSLESVLNVIRSTLDLTVTVNGSFIELSGETCTGK